MCLRIRIHFIARELQLYICLTEGQTEYEVKSAIIIGWLLVHYTAVNMKTIGQLAEISQVIIIIRSKIQLAGA